MNASLPPALVCCVEVVQVKYKTHLIVSEVLKSMMAYAGKYVQEAAKIRRFLTFFLGQGAFLQLCELGGPIPRNLPGEGRDSVSAPSPNSV